MTSYAWLKQPVDKRLDERVAHLSIESIAIYYMLREVAGLCNADGSFTFSGVELTDEQIVKLINNKHVDLSNFKRAKKEMFRSGIMAANGHGPYLTDYQDEQITREEQEQRRAQTRERVQRWREKQHDETGNETHSETDDVTPLHNASRNNAKIKIKNQNQNQNQNQIKNQPTTPTPPSKTRKSGRVAGVDSKSESSSADSNGELKLTRKQIAVIARIKPILQQSGLRNPLLDRTLNATVTIRNFKSADKALLYVLGALASTYADEGVNNKNAVAAHRIENNNVPAEYVEKPELWKSLPTEVLKAAGIDDLERYVIKQTYDKFGIEH